MKNHDPNIESLIDLFMQSETSLEQEQELSKFFADSSSIPEEWEAYKEMFAYFDAGMPVEAKHKHKITRHIWLIGAAAAIAALVILVAPHWHHSPTNKQTSTPQAITVENVNKTVIDTIIKTEQPQVSPIIAKHERKAIKTKVHINNTPSTIDSIEIEREKGEVEQAQQELLADKFIVEQERQAILNEQYITRTQAYQAQQALQSENPQFIQVVFK